MANHRAESPKSVSGIVATRGVLTAAAALAVVGGPAAGMALADESAPAATQQDHSQDQAKAQDQAKGQNDAKNLNQAKAQDQGKSAKSADQGKSQTTSQDQATSQVQPQSANPLGGLGLDGLGSGLAL